MGLDSLSVLPSDTEGMQQPCVHASLHIQAFNTLGQLGGPVVVFLPLKSSLGSMCLRHVVSQVCISVLK